MKRCLLVACLLLAGCAETRIYERGQLVAVIQADATNVTVRTGNGTYFHADTLNHSTPTIAVGRSTGYIATGVSGIVTAAGLAGVIR